MLKTSKRNFQIDSAILKALNPKSKTLSCLYRDLNSGFPASALRGGRGWEILFGKKKLDKRTIKRHLKYLIREGRVFMVKQEKTILWRLKSFTWRVKYYFRPEFGFPKLFKGFPLFLYFKGTSISNPFVGEEGMLKFLRWLKKLQ